MSLTTTNPTTRGSRYIPSQPVAAAKAATAQRPWAAAWYCSNTLAGIRPRALTAMPWALAHARTSPLRCRPADVRAVRRAGPRPALREAAAHAAEGTSPSDDLNSPHAYREHLARVLVGRALEESGSRA